MSRRSSLDPEEQALWAKVVATVTPLHRVGPIFQDPEKKPVRVDRSRDTSPARAKPSLDLARDEQRRRAAPERQVANSSLDGTWDRRFKKGAIIPDVSIDLHGIGLAGAYTRLDDALEQAVHQRFRVVLLVTGKARSHDRASGQGRGAIASVVRDWLAASRHAGHISAVRNAHPRHGGAGALYIILKR